MPPPSPYQGEKIQFVTGRLAEPALKKMVVRLEKEFDVSIRVQVLPISVAALMSPRWIARHITVEPGCQRIILPGYCEGDLGPLKQAVSVPVDTGPRDLRRLPELFGGIAQRTLLDDYSIEIIAEINHAPRLTVSRILEMAEQYRQQGADVIDIGCLPGMDWPEAGTVVGELVQQGFRVSIDSMQSSEIAVAADAGAELVLSVNSTNRRAAPDWGCEVVVIPDRTDDWLQIGETIDFLTDRKVPFRIDPVLEPIGTGFTASLNRYIESRKIWPDLPIMMGIGNLTELTDVDSAGVNLVLLAICQDLQIASVLTTEVINWARTSVRECDLGRRLVHAAAVGGVPPKNMDSGLVCLRDPDIVQTATNELQELATRIRDRNWRLAVADGQLHMMGAGQHWSDQDAFELIHQVFLAEAESIDSAHAFYLGYELCKAATALQLGKQYEQDEPLNWGHLSHTDSDRRRLKAAEMRPQRKSK